MILAVTASGRELDSRVEPCFAAASYFIVYDTLTHLVQCQPVKTDWETSIEVGPCVASELSQLDIDVLLTGRISPQLAACLEAAGVRVCCRQSGLVIDVLEEYVLFGSA